MPKQTKKLFQFAAWHDNFVGRSIICLLMYVSLRARLGKKRTGRCHFCFIGVHVLVIPSAISDHLIDGKKVN